MDPDKFTRFSQNPAIGSLASTSRWSVSGSLRPGDNAKAPLDVRHLVAKSVKRGCWSRDENCCFNLFDLNLNLPDATNFAFYLDAEKDGFVCLDIEPSCPKPFSQFLVFLAAKAGAQYVELSCSGKGFHVLIPASIFNQDTLKRFLAKASLRSLDGSFEFLIRHWVTFTANSVTFPGTKPAPSFLDSEFHHVDSIQTLVETLLNQTPASTSIETPRIDPDVDYDFSGAKGMIDEVVDQTSPFLSNLTDFDNDHSRWEFSIANSLWRALLPKIAAYNAIFAHLDTPTQSWLLYQAMLLVIPHRPKHDSLRDGLPLLWWNALRVVSLTPFNSISN